MRIDLLFERFISTNRHEPPDIDVDFEHERREDVIQYIYERYGRDRAGITATVISYRGRSRDPRDRQSIRAVRRYDRCAVVVDLGHGRRHRA